MTDTDGIVEFSHRLVFWGEQTICKLGLFPLSHKDVWRCPLSAGCNCTHFHL